MAYVVLDNDHRPPLSHDALGRFLFTDLFILYTYTTMTNTFDGLCTKNSNHAAIQEILFFQQQRENTTQELIEELEKPEPPTDTESTGLNKNGFRFL